VTEVAKVAIIETTLRHRTWPFDPEPDPSLLLQHLPVTVCHRLGTWPFNTVLDPLLQWRPRSCWVSSAAGKSKWDSESLEGSIETGTEKLDPLTQNPTLSWSGSTAQVALDCATWAVKWHLTVRHRTVPPERSSGNWLFATELDPSTQNLTLHLRCSKGFCLLPASQVGDSLEGSIENWYLKNSMPNMFTNPISWYSEPVTDLEYGWLTLQLTQGLESVAPTWSQLTLCHRTRQPRNPRVPSQHRKVGSDSHFGSHGQPSRHPAKRETSDPWKHEGDLQPVKVV
jgi:hypothetical protein